MKKILSVVTIAIIALVLGVGTVNAAQTVSVAASADKATIKQGETVTVTVSLKDLVESETGVSAFIGTLKYDTTIFEKVKKTDLAFQNGWIMGNYNENEGSFSATNSTYPSKAHEAIKITLKVKEDAKVGNATISFKELNLAAEDDKYPSDVNVSFTIAEKENEPTPTPEQPTPTPETPTPTPTPAENKVKTLPTTGVENYIVPVIAIIAVAGIFAYVRYNRVDK